MIAPRPAHRRHAQLHGHRRPFQYREGLSARRLRRPHSPAAGRWWLGRDASTIPSCRGIPRSFARVDPGRGACLKPQRSPDDLRAPRPARSRAPETHRAGRGKARRICCLRNSSRHPYFCAERRRGWYDLAEPIPDGPTVRLADGTGAAPQDGARRCHHELDTAAASGAWSNEAGGIFYNAAAVIDEQGTLISVSTARNTCRACHRASGSSTSARQRRHARAAPPQARRPGPAPRRRRLPSSPRAYGRIVYICYDRHFPEGRELGLAGSEIVFNQRPFVAGLSEYLWKLEQPAHAVANQYFVGAINRVGFETLEHPASSTAVRTSAIRGVRSSPRPRATGTKCSSPT